MLTSQQIVTLATQIAKCPSFTAQAGQFLNMILAELCQDFDFAVNRKTVAFNFNSGGGFSSGFSSGFSTGVGGSGSGPYPLPLDWLRADRNDVFYTITGVKYVMVPLELAEYNALVQQAGLAAYPEWYAVDNAPLATQGAPLMYVWPPAGGAYPVTAVYFSQQPDITTPETSTTIPWFPNQTFLIRRLAGELMNLTNDDRASMFLGGEVENGPNAGFIGAAGLLRNYLKMKDDSQVVKTVTLDRRRFGAPFDKLRNTKTIGW